MNFQRWRILDSRGGELFIFAAPLSDAKALEQIVRKSFPGSYLEKG